MQDEDVLHGIQQLAEEEHELFRRESAGEISEEERRRLKAIEVRLDQCWDLLRQRRALRAAGADPDAAKLRDERTVEGYLG